MTKSKFVMEAPNDTVEVTNLVYPVMVQPKLDGFRCVSAKGQLLTRSGKLHTNSNLAGYFNTLKSETTKVLDGELYVHGMTFPALSSMLRKDGASLDPNLKFYVFDSMDIKDWEAKACKVSYETRLRRTREIINDKIADYSKVIDMPNDFCDTPKEVIDLYKQYLKKGYEGAMIRDPNGLYLWKKVGVKSGNVLKLKPFKSVDLKIEEIYSGEGKNEGKAGGIVVNFNGHAVRVGTGFDDTTREAMARKSDKYLGKTVEIRYLEVTEKGSLRHTSFKRFRPDKDTP